MIVKNNSHLYKNKKIIRCILLGIILIVSLSCVIYANGYTQSSMNVNKEKLPELDRMYNIESNTLEKFANDNKDLNRKFQEELGISLLSSELASENPYVIEKIKTDNKDYVMLTFNNYIIGDTSNYNYNKEKGVYDYQAGKDYFSPIRLKVDIMLSEEQMRRGWHIDYLGEYQFEEQYISKQGYKVNIIKDTVRESNQENYISEKCAIFVADGIRYTLKGRTSIDNIKYIVDTMKYKN